MYRGVTRKQNMHLSDFKELLFHRKELGKIERLEHKSQKHSLFVFCVSVPTELIGVSAHFEYLKHKTIHG